ncbi:MAG: SpoIIE family protein phosphatase [Alphaproteobacteria bacterium]|nr:SpoIIE family protein phosphatase [Alphaproteobacteria bacterium]
MARPRSLQRSLVVNLCVNVVLLGAFMLGIALWTQEIIVKRATSRIIRDVQNRAVAGLASFDRGMVRVLELTESWLEDRWSGEWTETEFEQTLVPLLGAIPYLSSVMVADPSGNLYVLTQRPGEWRTMLFRPNEWGRQVRTRQWSETQRTPRQGWVESAYSVFTSPWFTFARGIQDKAGRRVPMKARLHVSDPRAVTATGVRGRIVSVAVTRHGGDFVVMAFQANLETATELARSLRRLDGGRDAILYGSPNRKENLIFLAVPNHPGAPTIEDAKRHLLRPPSELGGPVSDLVDYLFEQKEYILGEPARFSSGGEPWWGIIAELPPFADAVESMTHPRWLVVARSEAELLATIPNVIPWIIAVTLVIVTLAIWRAARLATTISRPIEELVDESRRMQRLDFEQERKFETDIVELGILGTAMDSMRRALWSYASVSEEERMADAIMRATLPISFPQPSGFQIEALRRPAAEPCGAVFDVIQAARSGPSTGRRKTARSQGGVDCLMLDPQGAGLEAAMLSAQLRAVFRAAVHAEVELGEIARAMDVLLREDLRNAGSVRAWFGDLNVDRATLSSISAGFETPLHYRAHGRRFAAASDAGSSLGGPEKGPPLRTATVKLSAGDIFVVASIGVIDALNTERERFGSARIETVIAEHASAPAAEILAHLETTLETFCEGAQAMADQTVLLIKREG